jgi:predicted RNA-binding protein YlxR (DUF448 family)
VLGPDGAVVPDLKEKLPGRGVWLTAAHETIAEAVKRKAFGRAFKAQVKVQEALPDQVGDLLAEAALRALSLANKAGDLVFGQVDCMLGHSCPSAAHRSINDPRLMSPSPTNASG